MAKTKYSINSFFAGIGGFDIAFEQSGFKTLLLCEINPFCNQILARHWPKVRKEQDINEIKIESLNTTMSLSGCLSKRTTDLGDNMISFFGIEKGSSGFSVN